MPLLVAVGTLDVGTKVVVAVVPVGATADDVFGDGVTLLVVVACGCGCAAVGAAEDDVAIVGGCAGGANVAG